MAPDLLVTRKPAKPMGTRQPLSPRVPSCPEPPNRGGPEEKPMNRTLMTLSFVLFTLIPYASAQTTFSNLDDTSSGYSWQYFTGGADQASMTQGVTTFQQDGAS